MPYMNNYDPHTKPLSNSCFPFQSSTSVVILSAINSSTMEFKYRAIDKRPPILSSSTPNNAVLHNQDSSFGRNVGDNVNRDSLSQIPPMEAEILREHFILEEIRRRELKAEIIREFMFERQMSFLSNAAGERCAGFFSPSVSNDGPVLPPFLNFGCPDGIWASERFPGLFSSFPFGPSTKLSSMEAGIAYYVDSDRRSMGLIGGTENGKTSLGFGPHLEATAFSKPEEVQGDEKTTLTRNCKRGLMIQQLSADIPKPQAKKHKSQGSFPLWGNMKEESLLTTQNDDEIPPSTRTKTPKKQTTCALCEVILTSEKMLEEHLKGKKHKAKEARLNSTKLKLVAKDKCGPTPLKEETQKQAAKLNEEEDDDNDDDSTTTTTKELNEKIHHKFWCKLCDVGTCSEVSMDVHQNGSKHMKLLQKKGGGLIIVSTLPDTIEEDKTTEDGEMKVEENNN